MKLQCYLLEGAELDIHPAGRRRTWMDGTPDAFAYRCLPLAMANSHGWEIRCSGSLEARWNGGSEAQDVEVCPDGDGPVSAYGNFGSGILTFEIPAVFRTPPGVNLWVTGPVNQFKHGIQALSALIETDWMPYSFSMNWKFTQPGIQVRFEKGEPFCFLFPVHRRLVEQIEPELALMSSDPGLENQYHCARNKRLFLQGLHQLRPRDTVGLSRSSIQKLSWQKWYSLGKLPDESGSAPEHQTLLHLRPFLPASAEPTDDGG